VALLGQTASFDPFEALDPAVVSGALDSSFGRGLGVRLGAGLLLWLLIGIAQGGWMRAAGVAVAAGCVLAFLDGRTAHAASLQPAWLGLTVNAVHLAAMGLWVGGTAAWFGARRLLDDSARVAVARRFGWVARGCVAALLLSGLPMALAHFPAATDLVTTAYGQTLLLKLALAAIVVGLAVKRFLSSELVGISVVLLAAALLVSLPPPA
jgi:copper transport protein